MFSSVPCFVTVFFSILWNHYGFPCPRVGLIDFCHLITKKKKKVINFSVDFSVPVTLSPRPRVGGSAGRTGRSYGRTVDPTPLIRRGTSEGRTAAAAG